MAQYVTVKTFVDALRKLVVEELQPQLLHAGRPLSETPPFPWSRRTLNADKCVFNLVPCENAFEEEFARFLQKADDVERFTKLPDRFGFTIDYTDGSGNLKQNYKFPRKNSRLSRTQRSGRIWRMPAPDAGCPRGIPLELQQVYNRFRGSIRTELSWY